MYVVGSNFLVCFLFPHIQCLANQVRAFRLIEESFQTGFKIWTGDSWVLLCCYAARVGDVVHCYFYSVNANWHVAFRARSTQLDSAFWTGPILDGFLDLEHFSPLCVSRFCFTLRQVCESRHMASHYSVHPPPNYSQHSYIYTDNPSLFSNSCSQQPA